MILRLFAVFSASALLTIAQDPSAVELKSSPAPDREVASVKPSVKKLDESRYQVGGVTFDQITREIRFPVTVNMTEGLLEFLVVHKNGKLHESLFHTEISPTHLNLAFTLLRYKASKELYPLPNEAGGTSDRYPDVPAEIKAAARVLIDAEWVEDGKTRRISVNEMIQHEVKASVMPPGPWIYGGSDLNDGKFVAETTGDVIAIYLAMSALVNYPGEDHGNDDVWIPFPKRVPAEGTAVTLIISPHSKEKPPTKP